MTGNVNVNFTGNTYYSPRDIENLAKYATGVAISHQPTINGSDLMAGCAGNLVVQGAQWLKNNKGNYAATLKAQAETARQLSNLYRTQDSFTKGISAVTHATSSADLLAAMPSAENLAKMSKSTQGLFNQAKIAAETLGQTGSAHAYTTANQLLCKANAAAAKEAATTATGWWGKVKNFFGINKASAAINTAAAGSKVGSACWNTFKSQGGPAMLVLEGATETITNVVPTFKQLGVKAGMKQVGKSAVKTVASVSGWVAGAALGTKIGAAIGSIIPGAGTAIGAIAGAAIGTICSLVGGTLGSKLAKKGAEAVVGKDELVLAQERQAKQLAQAAQTNGTVLNQVVGAASERLNAEGVTDGDSRIAYNSLASVASGTSTSTMTQAMPQQLQSQASQGLQSQTAQSVYGTSNPFTTRATATPSFQGNSNVDFYNKDFMAAINGLA